MLISDILPPPQNKNNRKKVNSYGYFFKNIFKETGFKMNNSPALRAKDRAVPTLIIRLARDITHPFPPSLI